MQTDPTPVRACPLDDSTVFNQFLHDFYALRRSIRSRRRDVWHPPTDVYETDDEIVIKMSIPGVKKPNVAVEVRGEQVTIYGMRRAPEHSRVRTYHQMEIRNGYFERIIVLRKPFDPNRAWASLQDGFLYVHIPKAPELVRHTLRIKLDG